jgi:membrane protein implicated in regulation of membrane protease activity
MQFESWHLWVIATLIFIVLEIAVPSFVMMSIAIGCFLAFTGALLHAPLALQLILFCIGTIAGFIGVRPVMVRYAYRHKSIETNASGLVGKTGKVVEEINSNFETGRVAIDGDLWKAVSVSGDVIPVSEKVKVVQLNSIVVTVEPLEIKNQEIVQESKENNTNKNFRVKLGNRTSFIGFDDVLYIYSKNKIAFIVNREGKEFIHDESLDKLDNHLPREKFFRANRQFILTRHIISEIKAVGNGKVDVIIQSGNESTINISVSRLKAHAFRDWLKRT